MSPRNANSAAARLDAVGSAPNRSMRARVTEGDSMASPAAMAGQWSGHEAQITFSALIWFAAPLAIGAIRITRRDIH